MSAIIEIGDASRWRGKADAVFTHPYAPIPACLHGLPTIVNLYSRDAQDLVGRIKKCEAWLGGGVTLQHIGTWGGGSRNRVYTVHLPQRELDLSGYLESHEPFVKDVGWFPMGMTLLLLRTYGDIIKPPMVVWDGFCGRATVGKACQMLGLDSISLDIDPERVGMARYFMSESI